MATWPRRFVNLDGILPLFINSTFMFAFKWNSILSFWLTNSLLCFLAVNRDTKVAHQLLIYFLIDCRLVELPITESPFAGVSLCLHFPIYSFVQVSIISAWLGEALLVWLSLICLPAPAHTCCAQQRWDTSFKFSEPNSHHLVSRILGSSSYLERLRRTRVRLLQLMGQHLQ